MQIRKTILALLLAATAAALWTTPVLAVPGAGAIALEFPMGARYNGLGEAGVALSQDATSVWWNPGGLAFATDIHRRSIHAMQSKLVPDLADDIALYWGGYVSKLGTSGNFGASITYLDMGEQISTDDAGVEGDTFSSYMFAFGLAYGTKLTPNVGVGLGVKYYADKLADDDVLQDQTGGSGDTFAIDAGLLWKVPTMKMNVGVAISNIGPNIKHVDAEQSDPLPRKMTVGVAYGLYTSEAASMLLVADYLVPLVKWDSGDDDPGFGPDFDETEWGAGIEWGYVQSLFLRLGYKKGTGEIEDYTWGMGVDLARWVGQNIEFGFASVPQAKGLDRVSRFSLGFNF